MEPAIGINGLARGGFLFVIARRDGLAAQEDFVVLANLDFQLIYESAHRTQSDGLVDMVARHGGGAFRQAIAHNHIDARCMHKAFHFGRNGGTCCRKEVGALQSERLAQEADDGAVVEFVLHGQSEGRRDTLRLVRHPVAATHGQCLANEAPLHEGAIVHLLKHSLIHLLPETRHTRHTRGVNFLQGLQHVSGPQIDGQLCALGQTEVAPCPFEYMGEGQEIEDNVLLAQRKRCIVRAKAFMIHAIGQHHAFAHACCSAGVEDVRQVVHRRIGHAAVEFVLVLAVFAQAQELVEVDA